MSGFAILADATCDLGERFQKEYDIHVIHGHLTLPDKREVESTPRWDVFTREEFYAAIRRDPMGFTTAPANVTEFAAHFERYAAQGIDILALSISSGISGAHNFMLQARKEVLRMYPNVRICCVDTLRYGAGFGLMAIYAAGLRDKGMTVEEAAGRLEADKNRFHQSGWLDDLTFVARRGRITHAKAFFGTLAGVKPLGENDYNGLTTVLTKVKGAKAAYEVMLGYMERTIERPREQIIFIAQSDRARQAAEYKTMIEERFHPKAVYINDVYPLCGVNIGPGLMASFYMGRPISRDLSEEKAIMEELTGGNGK